ncbi:hypothetical protein BBJ28_00024623 [Nothophytophthora sp. Chile5]|nr:hypothetical protein BBJ28_00024623 [Nothophytophthora sp. Chile5]
MPMTTTTDQMLYAQPASVHFGGFELERTVQQRVRVHNNSAKAVRLRFTFPTGSKGFRAAFAKPDRPPFISAGLCEEIVVSFTPPAGFQYYYDCIQVRCEEVAYSSNTDVARGGATLIPLHAYPMANEVEFPGRMDFGVVPRGACARRHVDITCSVPVEFQYELRLTKAHPSFTVFPLTGTIPPRGEARIELEFRPLVYATASAELELHVSQLGFAPRLCTLVGSSSSTAIDAAQATEIVEDIEPEAKPPTTPSSSQRPRRSSGAQKKTRQSSASGGGNTSKSRNTLQQQPQEEEEEEEEDKLEVVRGLEIPHDLTSVTSVNFVLNQEPGKLKPKDLKKAIAANRELRLQQREEQAKLCTGDAGDDDEDPATLSFRVLVREEEGFLQRARVNKQVKDMFFQQELNEAAQAETSLEFQSHKVHLGQRLLSREEIAYLGKLREFNMVALACQQREKLRTTFTNVVYEPPGVSNQQQQQFLLGEHSTAVLPAHFTPAYTPDFKTYKNDLWARKQRVLRRLVRAVSTCVLRLRAQKRLDRIRAWLGSAKTRAQVREKVALDWQYHSQAGGGNENESSKVNASKQKLHTYQQSEAGTEANGDQPGCYLVSFPVVEEETTQKSLEMITVPPDWELKFNSFTSLELRPRDEALLMGHESLPLPALPTYVPLEQSRVLRRGAASECGVATSLLSPTSASKRQLTASLGGGDPLDVKTPSLLDLLPADVFLRPQAAVRPLVSAQNPRETDASYALRPQRVFRSPPSSFAAWQSTQPGLQSIYWSQEGARLCISDVYVAMTGRKQAEPLLPMATDPRKAGEGLALFADVWHVATSTTPALAEHADDVPSLSDSESDDERVDALGSTAAAPTISWERAVALFEDDQEGEDEVQDGALYEEGEQLGRDRGVRSFERYRHTIRLERAFNAHRQDLLERLPKVREPRNPRAMRLHVVRIYLSLYVCSSLCQRLEEVSAQIQHPDYALVVQGHGSERPLHHHQAATAAS